MNVISSIFDDKSHKLNLKMKKIIYLLVAITIVSCTSEPKDYVTFSGKIIS